MAVSACSVGIYGEGPSVIMGMGGGSSIVPATFDGGGTSGTPSFVRCGRPTGSPCVLADTGDGIVPSGWVSFVLIIPSAGLSGIHPCETAHVKNDRSAESLRFIVGMGIFESIWSRLYDSKNSGVIALSRSR